MLNENCARGIFKTAKGRIIRFAKGNLKYVNGEASLHTSQVNAYLGTNSSEGFDHFAFGATGVDGAPSPLNLYNYQSGISWYYTEGTYLTGSFDYGKMLNIGTSFATMTTDDFSAFEDYNIGSTTYSSPVLPSKANVTQNILYIVNDITLKPKELNESDITLYEKKYNAIFFLCTGYNSNPEDNNGITSWSVYPSNYWIADGYNGDTYNMLNPFTGNIEKAGSEIVEGEGYPVRLVHTEFDPQIPVINKAL